jgi:hypothetical protein
VHTVCWSGLPVILGDRASTAAAHGALENSIFDLAATIIGLAVHSSAWRYILRLGADRRCSFSSWRHDKPVTGVGKPCSVLRDERQIRELPEETTQLCSSLHVGLRRAIALSCKASANAVLKRRASIITEAKSVIRVPQLTGALRSAPLGESFLFQDSLEEAIKVQKPLGPILTKRVSLPSRNRPPPRHSLPTQVGTPREASLSRGLGKMLLGTLVLLGGQPRRVRGDKRGHIRPLKSKGTSDQASSSSSFPSKREHCRGDDFDLLNPRGPLTKPLPPPLRGSVVEGMTPGLVGHMVSKRFARPRYHPARSSSGFRLATAYNLNSQSCGPSTGLGQGFRSMSRSRIPSGQRGDSSYRQPRSRLLQPHFCGPKEAEGILEANY